MLFSKEIKEIEFNQESDLKIIFDYLKGFELEQISDDLINDSKFHEYHCLYIFLVGSFKLKHLFFPLKITSRESPDFIIYQGQNTQIGLEHTIATLESFKIALSNLRKYPEGSCIELCHYSPYKKTPKKQSDIGIILPGSSLKGEGWIGNQVERIWAEVMLNAIKKKVEILNKDHFEIKEQNILFIEDDSPVNSMKQENEAIQILKQQYNQTIFEGKYAFDKFCIFSLNTLIYDIFGKCIKISLRKAELPSIKLFMSSS